MSGVALQANLRAKCRESFVRFRSLDFAKKGLKHPERFLDVDVSLSDPFEIIDLAMALDTTTEQALEAQKNRWYDVRRAVLGR